MVLHPLEQDLDRLGAEVHPAVLRGQRVGLVDEQDAVQRTPDHPVRLDGGRADVLPDQARTVHLDQMAFLQQTDRAVHLGQEPRHGGLSRARVSEEHQVLWPPPAGPAAPAGLDLEQCDERAHLSLHRLQCHQPVELGQELVEALGSASGGSRPPGVDRAPDAVAEPASSSPERMRSSMLWNARSTSSKARERRGSSSSILPMVPETGARTPPVSSRRPARPGAQRGRPPRRPRDFAWRHRRDRGRLRPGRSCGSGPPARRGGPRRRPRRPRARG